MKRNLLRAPVKRTALKTASRKRQTELPANIKIQIKKLLASKDKNVIYKVVRKKFGSNYYIVTIKEPGMVPRRLMLRDKSFGYRATMKAAKKPGTGGTGPRQRS
jgi:hypothetical protein